MSKNYERIIQDFDDHINQYVVELENKIDDINFDYGQSITFTLSEDLDTKSIFNNSIKKGIYLFEVNLDHLYSKSVYRKTKVKEFAKDWKKKKNDSFFSPSIIKSKQKKYEEFNDEWLPLYIGKSKKLNSRIIEHIDLSPKKNTYAMKLKHRPNLIGAQFRV